LKWYWAAELPPLLKEAKLFYNFDTKAYGKEDEEGKFVALEEKVR
jgi:hypothetical protein